MFSLTLTQENVPNTVFSCDASFSSHVCFCTATLALSAFGRQSVRDNVFTAYHLNGSSTAQLATNSLPRCLVVGNSTSVAVRNTDTGVAVSHWMSSHRVVLVWDSKEHPNLTPSYTGRYRCSGLGNAQSANSFQLNVVGEFLYTCGMVPLISQVCGVANTVASM